MTNVDPGPKSFGPEALDAQVAEQLLAAVPAGVVDTLGRDTVLEIERLDAAIEKADELLSTSRPQFSQVVDTTFLEPEQQALLAESTILSPEPSSLDKRTIKGLKEVAKAIYTYCHAQTAQVKEDLKPDYLNLEPVVYSYLKDEIDELDLGLVEEWIDSLRRAASQLPSRQTAGLPQKSYITLQLHSSITKRALLIPSLESADRLVRWHSETIEVIDEIFNSIKTALRKKAKRDILNLMDTIGDAKDFLYDSDLTPEHVPAALAAESYLVDKLGVAYDTLQAVDAELANDAKMRALVQDLGATVVAKAQQYVAEEERKERAQSFNLQVTEARDILRGGRRIKNTKAKDIEQKADSLQYLLADDSEKTRLLKPEQRGLIIAILSDRLVGLKEVLERLQSQEPEEVAQTAEQMRPDVVRELKEFNLSAESRILLGIFRDFKSRQKIEVVLNPVDAAKVKAALVELSATEEPEANSL